MCLAATVVVRAEENHAAETLKFESDNNPDGSHAYAYETSNGISAQETGANGESAGSFKWTSPEGELIEISYTAGADGYVPVGNVVPVAPEIPAHVLRLVEWLQAHPSDDDGSYKP